MTPAWLRRERPKPYRELDFRRRLRYRDDYLALAGHLVDLLAFETVYDVGCGNGFLLEGFHAAGKEAAGVEASPAVRGVLPAQLADSVLIDDFSAASGSWELVCCVEVAEHIEPARSAELVATITDLATRWIYFTAAPPGQAGRGHINCRPHAEWLGWLEEAGWACHRETTDRLRERLSGLTVATWLKNNSFVLSQAAASG